MKNIHQLGYIYSLGQNNPNLNANESHKANSIKEDLQSTL